MNLDDTYEAPVVAPDLVPTVLAAKMCTNCRHLSNINCLSYVMCPLLAPVFQGLFFAVAINSTN
jgi:hypothetical protein